MHQRGQLNWDYLPDRRWIQTKYLPKLDGRLLYIGVEQCTDFYSDLTKADYITIDSDPDCAVYGSKTNHIVGDFLDHCGQYDHVSFYGILGFCPQLTDIDLCHRKLDELVISGGTVMFGHHVSEQQSLRFWQSEIARSVFKRYAIIERAPVGITTNYIWWGRKPI